METSLLQPRGNSFCQRYEWAQKQIFPPELSDKSPFTSISPLWDPKYIMYPSPPGLLTRRTMGRKRIHRELEWVPKADKDYFPPHMPVLNPSDWGFIVIWVMAWKSWISYWISSVAKKNSWQGGIISANKKIEINSMIPSRKCRLQAGTRTSLPPSLTNAGGSYCCCHVPSFILEMYRKPSMIREMGNQRNHTPGFWMNRWTSWPWKFLHPVSL